MKRKIKLIPCILFSFIILIVIAVLSGVLIYNINIGSVSKKSEEVTFTVNENETFSTLSDDLKKENLIKSEFFYKIYIKLNKPNNLQKGIYKLNRNMGVSDIVKMLGNGTTYSESIRLTFREGLNMRKIINVITTNTNIKEQDILNKLNDKAYLDKLITNYWFLKADIKNNDIYYSLEGYLYPDTYEFKKDAKIEDIIETMLDNTEKKLEKYKNNFFNSKYTVHQIMTLASIVELESVGNDRNGVAGVFYNRLNNNWSLGSDVTTYYGAKVDMSERDLYKAEIDTYNAYNTRSSKMAGKLPVGPICNPSIISIEATLNPTSSNYFYFVADKNKKTYFTKTYNEHLNLVAKLKKEGLWYEY